MGNEVTKQPKKGASFSTMFKFFREVRAEMKKVIWPTKKQVINNTTVVIISIIIIGTVIWGIDAGFGGALNYLIKK